MLSVMRSPLPRVQYGPLRSVRRLGDARANPIPFTTGACRVSDPSSRPGERPTCSFALRNSAIVPKSYGLPLSTSSFQGDIRMLQRTFHTGSSSLAFRVSADAGEGPAGKTGVGFVKPDKVDMSLFPPPSRALSTDDCEVHFVRSGGAGGQNVNKVSTKADMRFDFMKADFLPGWVKENLREQVPFCSIVIQTPTGRVVV